MTKKVYLEDSYLSKCSSQIRAVNKEKNEVTLDQTIFYPGGGGQPMDRGYLLVKNKKFTILEVSVKNNKNEPVYKIDGNLLASDKDVELVIDAKYRLQNMKYHTLLHLISGYFYHEYGALATSSQIEADHARLELIFPEACVPDYLDKDSVEKQLTMLANQGHHVSVRSITREQLEQDTEFLKTYTDLLHAELENIRLVAIDKIDEQACGGTHVQNTCEIGPFQLLQWKKKGRLKRRIKVSLG